MDHADHHGAAVQWVRPRVPGRDRREPILAPVAEHSNVNRVGRRPDGRQDDGHPGSAHHGVGDQRRPVFLREADATVPFDRRCDAPVADRRIVHPVAVALDAHDRRRGADAVDRSVGRHDLLEMVRVGHHPGEAVVGHQIHGLRVQRYPPEYALSSSDSDRDDRVWAGQRLTPRTSRLRPPCGVPHEAPSVRHR